MRAPFDVGKSMGPPGIIFFVDDVDDDANAFVPFCSSIMDLSHKKIIFNLNKAYTQKVSFNSWYSGGVTVYPLFWMYFLWRTPRLIQLELGGIFVHFNHNYLFHWSMLPALLTVTKWENAS